MSESQRVAAGLHPPPSETQPFAAVQAAWRFYANPRVTLPHLAGPLIGCARLGVACGCDQWALNVLDWSPLHYGRHTGKRRRMELGHTKDLGYDLLSSLVISDRDGSPIAPVCLELEAADGVHSTRSNKRRAAVSRLDGLTPVITHVQGLGLKRPLVHIIDREADSVGHFRRWEADRWHYLVRADDNRVVRHEGREYPLGRVARHKVIPGPPVTLRLIVSEIRDEQGRLLARWLLLTNLPAEVSAATVALWYYWRWRIESYHKLLKGAGQQVERWQQETPTGLARRLTVAAMATVVVWHLARDERP